MNARILSCGAGIPAYRNGLPPKAGIQTTVEHYVPVTDTSLSTAIKQFGQSTSPAS